ncbi:MAG: prepilin-type N-terminal cleavage/methylation domain-containing protein [Gammaproteobacteria bacterium]|nr:prepilin-type N-terminal cleavage/methylation domain-containing protein [Gammaproteobacteria bacterium]
MITDFNNSVLIQRGFTLVEVTLTLLVLGLMLASFGVATSTVFEAREAAFNKEMLTRDAALAMDRMVTAAKETPWLLLPLADDPATPQIESLREQSVPAKTGQEKMTAVLALRLARHIDRDSNGIPDADNDFDGLIDEDPGEDSGNDDASGIFGIDDDHDGETDEEDKEDDDEDGTEDEDAQGSGDNDKDRSVDEDTPADLNADGAAGVAGVDDDGDNEVDEGSEQDDDEDGESDEDWYDAVVFYIRNGALIERQPLPFDVSGDGDVDGMDFIETVLAENIAYFRVERIDRPGTRSLLVDISIELQSGGGESARLNTRVRVPDRS